VNLTAHLFPPELLWLANAIFAVMLGKACWYAPWRSLLDNAARVNALVGLLFVTGVFWQLSAGVRPGFHHHLLGATLFLLMFGWRIALLALSLILLATWTYAKADMATLGVNGLVMIAVPVFFSEWVLRLSRRYLPKTFSYFTLWNGFFCAGLAMLMTILCASGLMVLFSQYTWASVQHNYLVAAPIIMFAESFATGAVVTGFVIGSPEAIFNFEVDEYLTGK
jgi:uncharacterized membrane protein